VRRRADLRSAVGARHEYRAVHLLCAGEDPVTLAELAAAYLVNALVDLHSADWASLGLASYGTPPAAPALRLAPDEVGRLMAMAGAIIRSRTAQAKNDDSESRK
jgi:hypothetical protein